MKRRHAAGALILLFALPGIARAQGPAINIVPRPDSIETHAGGYILPSPIVILATNADDRLLEVAHFLGDELSAPGITVRVGTGTVPNGVGYAIGAGRPIVLEVDPTLGGPEAYLVDVQPSIVRITGASAAGVLWGAQTLRQLLPTSFEQTGNRAGRTWAIPSVTIRDQPRFPWRGVLLDAGRHFFPVSSVKHTIDLMSRYKLNVLHWHLTEDQGWRIEIRKYPRLTQVGAWRIEPDGSRYGGFYSQRDVREVVDYAHRRGVAVVPEIEMPGHSSAAIAAYPELGCTGDSITVPSRWGVFPDIYCAGNERTFTFLQDVLDEVMALFPSRFIHIGGDEVPKDRWHACAPCQERMGQLGLRTEAELQSWFVTRIARYLEAHGRHLIGWDEILEGGLAPGATVQAWRDTAAITAATSLGHAVIASPGGWTYIDASPRDLPLEHVYGFDPVPHGMGTAQAALVLGGEAPLWSEHITPASLDLMAFPRLLAFAEAVWRRGPGDYADFKARLDPGQYARLHALGVRYGPEDRDIVRMTPVYDSVVGRTGVQIQKGVDDITVHFTLDGSTPTTHSPVYDGHTGFGGSGTVTLKAFIGNDPLLDERVLTLEPHLAARHPVRFANANSPRYPGTGPYTLTDGVLGSTDLHDGLWMGWQGADMEAVVDLGERTAVSSVEGSFLQDMRSWVLLPRSMSVWLSDDGTTWRSAGDVTHQIPPERADAFTFRLVQALPGGSEARYVKVLAHGFGALPAWHGGAGQPAWIFADELIVR